MCSKGGWCSGTLAYRTVTGQSSALQSCVHHLSNAAVIQQRAAGNTGAACLLVFRQQLRRLTVVDVHCITHLKYHSCDTVSHLVSIPTMPSFAR